MAGFCNIVIMGNVTRKPELRKTPGGMDVTDINVAVNAFKKGAPDNRQTTFYRASIFGSRAETATKYLDKGSAVILSGRDLEIRTYTKSDGSTGISPEFVADNWSFAGSKGGNGVDAPDVNVVVNNNFDGGFTSGAADKAGADAPVADVDGTINLDDIPF
ncbi:MAG: single-stranded DNA-binding protein [Candidatus Nomurabacteria bacterium]|jgi:single-strand DNA-binding protein|nr:single-stranded DNA-binding protein [Candidatus Nomurabacteria bacterium]